jgi:flagellar M-ring protein FliF
VAVSFDFTKVEKTEEKFDPESQVARSEQRSTEKSSSAVSGGIPGITSNLPGRQQTAQVQAGTPALSEKKNETINYEINKTISHVVSSAGDVKKLSVVVLVDGIYTVQTGSAEKKYSPRTEDEVRQLEDMVKKTVGFTVDRGDDVKVVNMPFENIAPEEITETAAGQSQTMSMVMQGVKYIAPLGGVILLFLFVIRPLMKSVSQPQVQYNQLTGLPQTVAELQRGMAMQALPPEKSSQEQLAEWAKTNPKEATNLIKGWMDEK